MKIEINISEFYLGEDEDLESGLKQYIIREVFDAIGKSIRERVEKQITMEVKDQVEKTMYSQISKAIADIIAIKEMPSKNDSKKMVSMEAYVRECFIDSRGWQNFDDVIKKLATNFSDELRKRYDILFASQIVSKLNDNGLLKQDVINLLLNPVQS